MGAGTKILLKKPFRKHRGLSEKKPPTKRLKGGLIEFVGAPAFKFGGGLKPEISENGLANHRFWGAPQRGQNFFPGFLPFNQV